MLLTLNSKEQIKYSVKERNIFSRAFVLSECREIQKHSESDVFGKYISSRNETKNTFFGRNIYFSLGSTMVYGTKVVPL